MTVIGVYQNFVCIKLLSLKNLTYTYSAFTDALQILADNKQQSHNLIMPVESYE